MTTAVHSESPSRKNATWFALLMLSLTIASCAAMFAVFSPLQEIAKLDLGLTDFQVSMVAGIAVSIPVAVLSIPLGWMVDHKTRVWILIGTAAVSIVGAAMTAFVQDFTLLFAARMLAGIGATCGLPVAISIAADLCLPHQRGRSLLALSMGKVVGTAAAFAAGGVLFGHLTDTVTEPFMGLAPWRVVQLIFAAASAVLLLPVFLLREPARQEIETNNSALTVGLGQLWARRRFLAPLFIGQIGVIMADASAGVWAAPVLMRDFNQQPEQFAGWMGGVLLLSGVLGAVIGAFAADIGHKTLPGRGILIGAVVAAVIATPCALFPIMPDVVGFGVMLAVLLLAGTAMGLLTATAIAVLVPNEIRGLCLSAFVIVGALVGLGIAPVLVSLGSKALGGEAWLSQSLAIVGVVTSIMSLIAFFMAMRAAPRPQAVLSEAQASV